MLVAEAPQALADPPEMGYIRGGTHCLGPFSHPPTVPFVPAILKSRCHLQPFPGITLEMSGWRDNLSRLMAACARGTKDRAGGAQGDMGSLSPSPHPLSLNGVETEGHLLGTSPPALPSSSNLTVLASLSASSWSFFSSSLDLLAISLSSALAPLPMASFFSSSNNSTSSSRSPGFSSSSGRQQAHLGDEVGTGG